VSRFQEQSKGGILRGLDDEVIMANAISARERDLDNFLVEELRASPVFRKWFFERLKHCIDLPPYTTAKVGKNPDREAAGGQTDLSCSLRDETGAELVHVLIEDKIALGFQPSQPERYGQEVLAARQRLGNRRAAAVLIAPDSNKAVLDNPCFDLSIRLEEIIFYLRERQEALSRADNPIAEELCGRLSARIDLLDALSKKRSYSGDWTPNPIPERVDFIAQYRALASELAPQFNTTNSSGGWKAKTILFTVPRIRGLPIRNIRHDFRYGVSLVLPRTAGAKVAIERSGLLPSTAITDNTNAGTLLIRLATVPLDPIGERFQDQRAAVETGIRSAMQLYEWASGNARQLAAVIAGR
jgi:hypothetical protein